VSKVANITGQGQLSFIVWPNHAGAVDVNGKEPMFGLEYKRGPITWDLDDNGELIGHARIEVPAGEWQWIIYCYNPFNPGYIAVSKLDHTLLLPEPGYIDLTHITKDEIKLLNPDPILHD
jgi:hypothetical protein